MAETAFARSVREFLEHGALERGLSPRTLEAYGRDLRAFSAHLAGRGTLRPRDVTGADVAAFVAGLERRGLAARSRARALVAVRRYARWLLATGAASLDPVESVLPPRLPRTLPKRLLPEEIEALLGAADPATALGLRDRAMLEVGYGAGLCSGCWGRGAASAWCRSASRRSSHSMPTFARLDRGCFGDAAATPPSSPRAAPP
jgi:integrase/recombinase XerD